MVLVNHVIIQVMDYLARDLEALRSNDAVTKKNGDAHTNGNGGANASSSQVRKIDRGGGGGGGIIIKAICSLLCALSLISILSGIG